MPVHAQAAIRDQGLWKKVGLALGAGRIAVGVAAWVAPVASVRVVGFDRLSAVQSDWLARMTAARDLAIGGGALASTVQESAPTERAAWLTAGALADLGDAVAIRRGAREGRLGRLPALGMVLGASGAAVLGALAAVQAVAFGDQPKSS